MEASLKLLGYLLLITAVAACGGGGGGSSSQSVGATSTSGATTTTGSGTNTGSTSGSTSGGTSGGSGGTAAGGTQTVQASGGLVSGGVSLSIASGGTGASIASGGTGASIASGGTGASIASGGTGAAVFLGSIQRFSSVVLNDKVINTDTAAFTIEGAVGSQGQLIQGQEVLVLTGANPSIADEVLYRSNVKGPLTSVVISDPGTGTGQLSVLGQTVLVNATTVYRNTEVDLLAVNDLLEVSGTMNANDEIIASYVELKSALSEYKVTGDVKNLTATTFQIGGLSIDFSNAVLDNFDSGPLSVDDVVEVRGVPSAFTAPAALSANKVERLPALVLRDQSQVEVEGFITAFSSATDFDVQYQPISTTSTTLFVNGDAGDLAVNVKVEAEGTVNSDGVLVATKVTIKPTDAIRTEGSIESISVANNTLTILGVTFEIRDSTSFEDKSSVGVGSLTLADLGIGDYMEVRGYLDGTSVVAVRIEREDFDSRSRLRGPVTAEDATNGVVDILAIAVQGQAGITLYEDLNENPISQGEFHDLVTVGTFVKASWDNYVATSDVADELSIED